MYTPRISDRVLFDLLQALGAVLIEGPKACGKSTTAAQQAKSILRIDEPTAFAKNIALATTNPQLLLVGDTPRLIDEWQLTPTLWDTIRHEVDRRSTSGQFILTGSAVPADQSQIHHTGTGRFARMRMRPMSLWESGESSGDVSLSELFSTPENIAGVHEQSLEEIAHIICRGGWPLAVMQSKTRFALSHAKQYVQSIAQGDLSRVDGVQRDSARVLRLLRSYARNQGTQASLGTLAADIAANEVHGTINERTVAQYLTALKQIFVVEDMPAWNPNLRSKTAIRTSDTHYFVDPSIATAALEIGPNDLLYDPELFGFMFETLCVRDLRVYAEVFDGKLYHYRDKNELECDVVLHHSNGRYGLIEIKLGGDKLIADGVKTLTKLSNKIAESAIPQPSFKMILTAKGDYAYRQADGIYIVPLGCLKD